MDFNSKIDMGIDTLIMRSCKQKVKPTIGPSVTGLTTLSLEQLQREAPQVWYSKGVVVDLVEPRIVHQDTDQLITPSVERPGCTKTVLLLIPKRGKLMVDWMAQCHENCNKQAFPRVVSSYHFGDFLSGNNIFWHSESVKWCYCSTNKFLALFFPLKRALRRVSLGPETHP